MKKLLLSVASLILFFGSCTQNEVEEIALSKKQNVVVATIEGQKTRLSVDYDEDANKFDLSWSAGDAFKVFNATTSVEYTWSQGDEFTPTTTPENPTYAVYPSSANPEMTGTDVKLSLNATPSVENINLPMWADASNGNVYSFKHLAAALQFTLNKIPEGYNKLIVEASNPISGDFSATLDAETPILESTSTKDDDKKVSVSFTAATTGYTTNQVFYIPLPVGTYTSLAVSVSNGTDVKALKSWENLTIERGKMYYTTATVNVASAEAVNDALANVTTTPTTVNLTEGITVESGDAIDIPDEAENVTLNFEVAPLTGESTPLVINQNEETTSSNATSELNITMPEDAENLYATINTPTTTVTLEGGSYNIIEATTATNTLIIGEGVTINNLKIKGGNVVLKGKVKNIESEVATTITLESDITLENACVISGDITLNLNGHSIKPNYIGYGTDNDAMFVVNVGAKLTIEDSSKDETGIIDTDDASVTSLNQLHCTTAIKLLGTENYSSGPVSSFVLNSGKIKGSIYGIAGNGSKGGTEVTINGGIVDSYHSGAAIYNPQKGDVTVTGGEIISTVGIEMRSGTLNVTGGTITARAEYELCITGASASGASFSDGIIIGVSQHATNNPLNINISGGTFNIVDGGYDGLETYYALYEEDFQDEDSDNITMSITGGTFTGKIKSENCENFIKGGTFSDSSLFDYLASEAEITLGADITISANTIIPAGVTIDGNNYSVSTDTGAGVAGKGKGVFLLTGGTIKNVNFTSPNTQYDIIVKAGGSVIEGCKFETASVVTDAAGTTTYGKRAIYTGSSVELTGNLTVTGCTFDDKVYAFNFLSGKNKMDVTFKDCTLGGWLSGTGASHTFTNCTFKKSGDYANYIPYCAATFNGCTFDNGFTISVKHGSTYAFDTNCKYNKENETGIALTDPNSLLWDFSGSGTDNGSNETVTIGEESNKWTIEVGENNTIIWKSSSNEGGSDA